MDTAPAAVAEPASVPAAVPVNASPLVYRLPAPGTQAVDAEYFQRVLHDGNLAGGPVTLVNGDALLSKMEQLKATSAKVIERDTRALLERVMDHLGMFLFPCPIYSSPLRMALEPRSTILVSSYEVCLPSSRSFCLTH